MSIRSLVAAALILAGLVLALVITAGEWGLVGFGLCLAVELVLVGVLIDSVDEPDEPEAAPPRRRRGGGLDLPPGS